MLYGRRIWVNLLFTYLVNSKTISPQTQSLNLIKNKLTIPTEDGIQDSKSSNKLKESIQTTGFTYEVRFPPQIHKPTRESNSQLNPQSYVDGYQAESMQINSLENINNDNRNTISTLKYTPGSLASNGVKQISSYLSLDNLKQPSSSSVEGYNYDTPSDELIFPNEENRYSLQNNPTNIPNETPGTLETEIPSPPTDGGDLTLGQESQGISNVLEPETYSLVKFTGSVFTPEGLPALGSEEFHEFPVNYGFSYFIRGQPTLGHEEARVDDRSVGKYWVTLPDGRTQEVRYTVDGDEGYRPVVTYRNPGDLLN